MDGFFVSDVASTDVRGVRAVVCYVCVHGRGMRDVACMSWCAMYAWRGVACVVCRAWRAMSWHALCVVRGVVCRACRAMSWHALCAVACMDG